MRIGSLHETDAQFYTTLPIKWSDGPIKILGTEIHPKYDITVQQNYDNLMDKVQNLIQVWNTRNLTPIGKIAIVNSLLNSQFIYKLQCLPSPSEKLFIRYQKMIREFIWDKKQAKIKYERLVASFSKGGLQLRDLKTVDASLKLSKMQKIIKNECFWTNFYVSSMGVKNDFFLTSNMHHRDVKKWFQLSFFRDVVYYWAKQSFVKPTLLRHIFQQPIWFNSWIKSNKKWLVNHDMYKAGVKKIIDLIDLDTGNIIEYNEFVKVFGQCTDFVSFFSIVSSVPQQWKSQIRRNAPDPMQEEPKTWKDQFFVTKIKKSKFCYESLREANTVSNYGIRTIWSNECQLDVDDKYIEKLFKKIRRITVNTKLRYFLYRIVTRKLITNIMVTKWNTSISSKCSFCKSTDETISHLLVDCQYAQKIWIASEKWIKYFHQQKIKFTKKIILLHEYKGRSAVFINFFIVVVKFFLYKSRCLNITPVFKDLIKDLSHYKAVEKIMAIRNDKLYKFARKWSDFSVFDNSV